jgi:hypothetical protein
MTHFIAQIFSSLHIIETNIGVKKYPIKAMLDLHRNIRNELTMRVGDLLHFKFGRDLSFETSEVAQSV